MPQLDKYIFFNHVVTLTIFFCLIYIFVRKTVIPQISTTLKYRKKRVTLFNSSLVDYEKLYKYSQLEYENKGKAFTQNIIQKLDKLITFYNVNSTKELLKIYNTNWDLLNRSSISNFLIKNRREFKRLNDTK